MSDSFKILEKTKIEDVKGFISGGVACGLKKRGGFDLGMVFAEQPADVFALFTTNKVKAAPVYVCKKHLEDNKARVLVVNSGNANACTATGTEDALRVCSKAAAHFGVEPTEVLPMSTGVIGEPLPVDKIFQGIDNWDELVQGEVENSFGKAIMTTDTREKTCGVVVELNGVEYRIVGVAKGSGMIHPNMATMLSFIFTDAVIENDSLEKAFKASIDKSFNAITVDGDTSTNDTVMIWKSGLAGNKEIKAEDGNTGYDVFSNALDYVTRELAKMIVVDGEGATKLVEIAVNNASSLEDAKKAAASIATSSLVKTAFFGEDPNWGRVICALGYSGADFDPSEVKLYFGDILLYDGGKANYVEEDVKKVMERAEFRVTLDMGFTKGYSHKVWTSDLSYDYVKINASYRS